MIRAVFILTLLASPAFAEMTIRYATTPAAPWPETPAQYAARIIAEHEAKLAATPPHRRGRPLYDYNEVAPQRAMTFQEGQRRARIESLFKPE